MPIILESQNNLSQRMYHLFLLKCASNLTKLILIAITSFWDRKSTKQHQPRVKWL